jgi:FMN phosphatase YigB (HAD superfamily)
MNNNTITEPNRQTHPYPHPHIFFDAEGTLYVTKKGRHYSEFWEGERTIENAKRIFELDKTMHKLLEMLKTKKIPMYLVSKHDHEQLLLELLEHFDVKDYFQEILLNGDKGQRIRELANRKNIPLNHCYMLGDQYNLDIEPVQKVGAKAFLVERKHNRHYSGQKVADNKTFLNLVWEQMTTNETEL